MYYSLIEDCTLCTLDESVMEYQPSAVVKEAMEKAGEPIPVVYIQRKPHPNGLLAYILSSFVPHPKDPSKNLPFIVDYIPHLRVDDVHAGNAVQKVIQR